MSDSRKPLLIGEKSDLDFLPKPNRCRAYLAFVAPTVDLITAVSAYVISERGILMTRLRSRGWDLPAGHIDAGESPEEAIRRECLEETGASLAEVSPLGFSEIEVIAPRPSGYRYPYPISYILGYVCTLEELGPFAPNDEASERAILPFSEAEALDSIKGNAEFYNEALRRCNVDRRI